MNYHLISAIVKGVWAINEESALGYAPLLNNIIGNSAVAFEFDEEQFKPFSIERSTGNYSRYSGWDKAPKGSVAVIPISGPMMKNDQYCGPVGMETIGQMIREADDAYNIDGILLKIDSPGGTVDGTVALAEIVENTKKPIIAFADGLMTSAALWVGSSADEIIAATARTQIGSVGVLLTFADLQPAYEKLGVKFHTIVADQSKDKNKMWEDLRAGKYDEYKKQILNPLADDFISHIKTAFPAVTDEHLTGKVFFASDLEGTIVNSIGNFDHAVSRLGQLIDEQKSTSSLNNNNTATMKKFEAINKVVGAELVATDDGVFLNEEQLDKVNTAIEQGVSDAAALETANTATADAEKAKDTAVADLDAANDTIKSLQAEIEDLKKKPGAETAKAVTESDKIVEEEKDGNVTSDSKSFIENLEAVKEELL